MPKAVRHRHARRLVVAVSHEDALAVLRLAVRLAPAPRARRVIGVQRPGLRQLSRWVGRALQHVDRRLGAGLAAKARAQHRGHVLLPWQLYGASALQHHHGARVCLGHGGHQAVHAPWQAHVRAVVSLGLDGLGKPHDHHGHVRLARRAHGLLHARPRGPAGARVVAGGVRPAGTQPAHGRDAPRVDVAGAASLVAGPLRHLANERHAGARRKRQRAVVGQKHVALGGHVPRDLAVCRDVRCGGVGSAGMRHRKGHEPAGALAHAPLAQRAGVQRRRRPPLQVRAAAGHGQVAAGLVRGGAVVHAAPVRHHHAVEAPLVAQDIAQEVAVVAAIDAVQHHVGAHHHLRPGVAHHHLEGAQVYLAQGALVNHAVVAKAPVLLRVHGKVLDARAHARGLHAAHVARGERARKQGVLREVLEVSAAERAPLYVEPWPQHHTHALRAGLAPDGGAHPLHELRVPRGRRRRQRREARGGLGVRHVPRARPLVAQPRRPVAHGKRRHARLGVRPRVPEVRADAQVKQAVAVKLGHDLLGRVRVPRIHR